MNMGSSTHDEQRQAPSGCRCPALPEGQQWFWCDAHQCKKSAEMRRQCELDPSTFAAWSDGKGPGQTVVRNQPAVPVKIKQPAKHSRRWSIGLFFRALLKHARDWFRKCSRKEIRQRLEICRSCDQFTGSACAHCGCSVNLEKRFLNKLAWRSESCPLGKWPSLIAKARHRSPQLPMMTMEESRRDK